MLVVIFESKSLNSDGESVVDVEYLIINSDITVILSMGQSSNIYRQYNLFFIKKSFSLGITSLTRLVIVVHVSKL